MHHNKLQKNVVLAIGLVTGFIFLASLGAFYAEQNFTPSCLCVFPPWIFIISFSSLGVFIGSLTYYFLTKHYSAERKLSKQGVRKFLNFLESEDKKIVSILSENSGVLSQGSLSKLTNIDKVKLSRRIDVLVKKSILIKEKNGMSNKIILDNSILDFLNIFKK